MRIKALKVGYLRTLPMNVQIRFMRAVVADRYSGWGNLPKVKGYFEWAQLPEVQVEIARISAENKLKHERRFAPD